MNAARRQARVVDGVELVLYPGNEPLPNYGVTDPDDIAWMGAGRLWDIDTGHDLMITEPQAVADLLLRLASL
jgi:hypothetical protein